MLQRLHTVSMVGWEEAPGNTSLIQRAPTTATLLTFQLFRMKDVSIITIHMTVITAAKALIWHLDFVVYN